MNKPAEPPARHLPLANLQHLSRGCEFGRELSRTRVRTVQINVGKLCNMACLHCHVDAGPKRTELMSQSIAERVLELLDASSEVQTIDITGGAPELNPQFRRLVSHAARTGREVIDRCNLSVLLEPGLEGTTEFLAQNRVHVIASLPCYSADNVERQRGQGAFDKSIRALRLLNALGYGQLGSGLELDLVYNPAGPRLPPPQSQLELRYRSELGDRFGIVFNRLLTLTNMPIARFAHALARERQLDSYLELLIGAYNSAALEHVMCRSLISVAWDGRLYDCDFNQMLELPHPDGGRRNIWSISSFDELASSGIATGTHCFGCTAGAGSSCGGALSS